MAKGESYEEFVEKFEPKKTTDDCYTPPEVYEKVVNFVKNRWSFDEEIIRPFYPGGDFENEDYTGKLVVDNPPFSILSRIVEFYYENNVKFFLFAPALTVCNMFIKFPDLGIFFTGATVTYENGAAVPTAYITNMCSGIELTNKILKPAPPKRKIHEFPADVKNSSRLESLAKRGVELKIPQNEYVYVRKLDDGYNIYGGGIKVKNEEIFNV